jgi:hypothetical protein
VNVGKISRPGKIELTHEMQRRALPHLSYSCATPFGPAVTRDTRPKVVFLHCGSWVLGGTSLYCAEASRGGCEDTPTAIRGTRADWLGQDRGVQALRSWWVPRLGPRRRAGRRVRLPAAQSIRSMRTTDELTPAVHPESQVAGNIASHLSESPPKPAEALPFFCRSYRLPIAALLATCRAARKSAGRYADRQASIYYRPNYFTLFGFRHRENLVAHGVFVASILPWKLSGFDRRMR